jgi:phosphoribosylformylglycinamidine synthase PurS subunit
MRFSVTVEVTGLEGISDPEGQAIERVLPSLGFAGIDRVRVGKLVSFEIEAADEKNARQEAEALCRKLLANPVMEQASLRLSPVGDD